MIKSLRRFRRNENGASLVEYALLVALVALAATVGMTALGTDINAAFTGIGTRLTTAIAG